MGWLHTPVILPGEFHGQRNLAGYSPWDHNELDATEWLTLSLFTFTPQGDFCHTEAHLEYSVVEPKPHGETGEQSKAFSQ